MKIRGKLILCLIINLLYVIFFYICFQVDKASFKYSVLHAILSAIIVYMMSVVVNKIGTVTISYLFIYINSVYFQMSMIKYTTRRDTFPRFIYDYGVRFKGTVIVFLILFFCGLMYKKKSRWKKTVMYIDEKISISNYGFAAAYLIAVVTTLYYLLIYNYNNSIYLSSNYKEQNKVISIFVEVFMCLGIYLSITYIKKHNIFTYFPLLIQLVALIVHTLKTGSRHTVFAYGVVACYLLIKQHKMESKWLFYFNLFSPIIMLIVSLLAFGISGRYSFDALRTELSQSLAYRFDLSDLAINILEKTSYFRFNVNELKAGIQSCIPSIITTQYKGFGAYYDVLDEAGLITTIDYSDTFFSMGVTAFGICGMILILPITLKVYDAIELLLNKLGKYSAFAILLSIKTLCRIESEWITFIGDIRNLIISLIIGVIIFNAFARKFFVADRE